MIRAGMLQLGGGVLGKLLAAGPGYRGPRVECGQGHEAEFASYRAWQEHPCPRGWPR